MLDFNSIVNTLREKDPTRLSELWTLADRIRLERTGNDVHFRGLVEISNYCRRNCLYCGIRASHTNVSRYRMSFEEILDSARLAFEFGYGTVVLQSGEDIGLDVDFIERVVRAIKSEFGLAVTLSLGQRTTDEWTRWKVAGADRYLLRFETSNPSLFEAIHPGIPADGPNGSRIDMLRTLRQIGYEIGSGVMVGVPGQSIDDLARDLLEFRNLDLDMIGCGPYLPHPDTPLGKIYDHPETEMARYGILPAQEQVENTNEMAFKTIAIARILCPDANIPSTTAIATIDGNSGRVNGLSRGANVIMPNLTPMQYRACYEIYPNKAATRETALQTHQMALRQIESIGRHLGSGPGSRRFFEKKPR